MGNEGSIPETVFPVGNYRLTIVKQLGEGGFADVFLVRDINSGEHLAVKRLRVSDKEQFTAAKKEINIMRSLPPHPNLVDFKDATMKVTASGNRKMREVFILMEFCAEGALYDQMNNILERRGVSDFKGCAFKEDTLLEIFQQVCTAVSVLHSQIPPITHRDLKVENVLIRSGQYKLCDFGSATTEVWHPKTSRERNLAEEDIQRNTTMAYRSPEMIDFYRKQPITEKADIWALGCLLYRMAFNSPAFEGSSLGILNCSYFIPPYNIYSSNIIDLIAYLLTPDPTERPDIFTVLQRVAQLRGVPCTITRPANYRNSCTRVNNSHASSKELSEQCIVKAQADASQSRKDPFVEQTPPQSSQRSFSEPETQPNASLIDALGWSNVESPNAISHAAKTSQEPLSEEALSSVKASRPGNDIWSMLDSPSTPSHSISLFDAQARPSSTASASHSFFDLGAAKAPASNNPRTPTSFFEQGVQNTSLKKVDHLHGDSVWQLLNESAQAPIAAAGNSSLRSPQSFDSTSFFQSSSSGASNQALFGDFVSAPSVSAHKRTTSVPMQAPQQPFAAFGGPPQAVNLQHHRAASLGFSSPLSSASEAHRSKTPVPVSNTCSPSIHQPWRTMSMPTITPLQPEKRTLRPTRGASKQPSSKSGQNDPFKDLRW